MKEKELRLALVCYGGVSLAIYEHGITKEVLKLVRASKAYHAVADANLKRSPGHTFKSVAGEDPEYCTEPVYFDLLKAIGRSIDLRVVVDVVAGSSAGGINGVALARALAHDLTLEPLTDLWLARADIQKMLAPEAKAKLWSKWYFRPLIDPLAWRLARAGMVKNVPDLEMKAALSTFLRSRWFHPPLDGPGFTALLLDGLAAMGEPKARGASLMPAGHPLDLVVTVTDFFGTARAIFVHDPPVVREREHRHVLRFSFEHSQGGAVTSDFDRDSLPSLAFAGRATASYPGAFPPAQIAEVDAVLARREQSWGARGRFIATNFRHYTEVGAAPEEAVLVDGSVLNNKPLSEALAVVRTHRAFREVDRRLVYIDPHPSQVTLGGVRMPGFFATLRGALSDLPRYEPIYDELEEINGYNDQVRRRRGVIEATRGQVASLVEKVTAGRLKERVTPDSLRRWRVSGPGLMASTGLGYNGWIRLMISEATEFLARLLGGACGYSEGSPRNRWIEEAIECWARRSGLYDGSYAYAEVSRESELPQFGRFIASFGVKYRRRRLIFVIQAINLLYRQADDPRGCDINPADLDVLKRRLYRCLDSLRVYDDVGFLSAEATAQIRTIFGGLLEITSEAPPDVEMFVANNAPAISALLDRLSEECDLVGLNEEVDAVLAFPSVFELGPECQYELLVSYLGFLFWDIVLLPMTVARGMQEASVLEEVLVDRISPDDAVSLRTAGEGPILRGGGFAGFGGFFSRAARENDYLWGRLHAVDRLFDLVASTAQREIAAAGVDLRGLKRRAFECVLDREAARLPLASDLVARLREAVGRL